MNSAFIDDHFLELLADAISEERIVPKKKTCIGCGRQSTRSKCDTCFRAYRVEKNREYRKKAA